MVKAEKARRVEDMLIHAATSGKLGGKVTEDQFIQMLEQVRTPPSISRGCCTHNLVLASSVSWQGKTKSVNGKSY